MILLSSPEVVLVAMILSSHGDLLVAMILSSPEVVLVTMILLRSPEVVLVAMILSSPEVVLVAHGDCRKRHLRGIHDLYINVSEVLVVDICSLANLPYENTR